ncbi:MAG: homocysteine S-methyltransferase family protein [Bacillota bacterium]|nr:homocysteine S-methyltransferase family protein [Bacillota bacterium]
MNIFEELEKRILILDGGMGTMIQKSGADTSVLPEVLSVTDPETIISIHRQYVEAGSDIIYANTFGANRYKLEGTGYSVEEVVDAAVKNAKTAAGGKALTAVSMGPLGKMLEPLGNLPFEEAYECFKQIAVQGEKSGADIAVIETMTDLYEIKAAVLAVKENTKLPIFASMTFEETGRTFTGCGIANMAMTLKGLGVSAMGINCSLGPAEIFPLAEVLCDETDLPVFIKPNAGLPSPETGEYDIKPDDFREAMSKYPALGVNMLGGCCGTTPEYIAKIKEMTEGFAPVWREKATRLRNRVCSATCVTEIDHTVVIGERLNPTGKKKLKKALAEKDFDLIMELAIDQVEEGAEILDVNTGTPEVDEKTLLPEVIKKIQSVTDVPLQIDTSDPEAMEAALRVYNGKPIVNSVNGEPANLKKLLPIIKHYGAAVIGLTLDENGIPGTAAGRVEIAERICDAAFSHGIAKDDIYIDCLTLTASAEQAGVMETLSAVRQVKEYLGQKTVLGVSNISFGLPNRPLINRTFLALALQEGLDMPIMNPADEGMMGTVKTFEMLANRDENAAAYIDRYKDFQEQTAPEAIAKPAGKSADPSAGSEKGTLIYALERGLAAETQQIVNKMLGETDEMDIVNGHLVPALDQIGKEFETGEIFLPQMMQAADAAQAGFKVIKESLDSSGRQSVSKGKVIIATVKGDIHDIGKNIVKTIMENFGYEMIDLGKDVPPEDVVSAVLKEDVRLVGLSALMTTTLKSMEDTIKAVKDAKPDCKVMVGGAVLTEGYARKIGADYYCKDAMQSVEAAREVLG